jgi:hypothetical protein
VISGPFDGLRCDSIRGVEPQSVQLLDNDRLMRHQLVAARDVALGLRIPREAGPGTLDFASGATSDSGGGDGLRGGAMTASNGD